MKTESAFRLERNACLLARGGETALAASQLVQIEAKKLFVVFSQGKPLLANFFGAQ
jgi:hypothetical protein